MHSGTFDTQNIINNVTNKYSYELLPDVARNYD